jgi:putative lipoprotein (rSAM/lipoprotein system)
VKINYRPLIKGTNWALAGLLSLLGFPGCSGDDVGADEYGTPWADYTIKGTVVNKANGKPVEGIKVSTNTFSYPEGPTLMYGPVWTPYKFKELAAVTTNAQGEFKLSDIDPALNYVPVIITDIDGEKNGSFASDTINIDIKDMELTGKPKGWYKGKYVSTLKVELTEKKADE